MSWIKLRWYCQLLVELYYVPHLLNLNILCIDFSLLFGQNKLNEHVMDLVNIQSFGMAFISLVFSLGMDLQY